MKKTIEVTEKGIRPWDLFKLIDKEVQYICMDFGSWRGYKKKPILYKTPKNELSWIHADLNFDIELNDLSTWYINGITIDYSAPIQNSLFERSKVCDICDGYDCGDKHNGVCECIVMELTRPFEYCNKCFKKVMEEKNKFFGDFDYTKSCGHFDYTKVEEIDGQNIFSCNICGHVRIHGSEKKPEEKSACSHKNMLIIFTNPLQYKCEDCCEVFESMDEVRASRPIEEKKLKPVNLQCVGKIVLVRDTEKQEWKEALLSQIRKGRCFTDNSQDRFYTFHGVSGGVMLDWRESKRHPDIIYGDEDK